MLNIKLYRHNILILDFTGSNLQLCFMNEQSSDTELSINNCDISVEDEKIKSAVCIIIDYHLSIINNCISLKDCNEFYKNILVTK